MKISAVTLLAMAFVLGACEGKSGPEEAAGGADAPAAAGSAAARPGTGDAVAAVQQSAGTAVARLAFVIETRPVKGQPFTVRLLASAAAPVPALQLTASSASLEITPSTAVLVLEAADAPASHDLTVTARQEGLTELAVSLRVADGPETIYAIPVLVMAAASAPAKSAAGGG